MFYTWPKLGDDLGARPTASMVGGLRRLSAMGLSQETFDLAASRVLAGDGKLSAMLAADFSAEQLQRLLDKEVESKCSCMFESLCLCFPLSSHFVVAVSLCLSLFVSLCLVQRLCRSAGDSARNVGKNFLIQ